MQSSAIYVHLQLSTRCSEWALAFLSDQKRHYFREYLHAEPTEIGSLRKEREFARRSRTAQIVWWKASIGKSRFDPSFSRQVSNFTRRDDNHAIFTPHPPPSKSRFFLFSNLWANKRQSTGSFTFYTTLLLKRRFWIYSENCFKIFLRFGLMAFLLLPR